MMIAGLFVFALGIVMTIQANIGYAPWDVFSVGLSITFGMSIGVASILTGFVLLIITTIAGEKNGIGTFLNIVLIGVFIDLFLFLNFIPVFENLVPGIIMLIAGLFLISIGSCFYIKAGFGAGPRDSLMVVLLRKLKIHIGIIRSVLELSVTVIGWLLGGMVGIGTVISVFGIGLCIQITFKVLRFDITSVKHESLYDTYLFLKGVKKQV